MDLRRRGKTIVLVSHELETIRRICDRAVWLDAGLVQADGKPQDVAQAYVDTVTWGTPLAGEPEPPVEIRDVVVLDADQSPSQAIRLDFDPWGGGADEQQRGLHARDILTRG